jgi:hypothetical protein
MRYTLPCWLEAQHIAPLRGIVRAPRSSMSISTRCRGAQVSQLLMFSPVRVTDKLQTAPGSVTVK